MSPFMGGSAPAMAAQIVDGYLLVTAMQLKRLSVGELDQLKFELDRKLRDLRGEFVAQDDTQAIQAKNRKISRITNAQRQIQTTLASRRRGG